MLRWAACWLRGPSDFWTPQASYRRRVEPDLWTEEEASPRRISLNKNASQWLRYTPGTEMHLLHGLSRVILDETLVAEGVAAARGAEYEALVQSLKGVQLSEVAKVTGVPEADIQKAARAFAGATRERRPR